MIQGLASDPAQCERLTLILTHKNHLTQGIKWVFEVKQVSVNDEAMTIRVGIRNLYQIPVPTDVFVAGRCRWRFRGPECAYAGDIESCGKTLADCVACGEDEKANGRPVRHPRQYGGFPGIVAT